MTWEAFRLTSKSPTELLTTLGPHAVDHLIRTALDTLWREHPPETRSLATVTADAREVFNRNLQVWRAIKKPSPQAFFQNMGTTPADGFLRQSLVLCWMMLPRAGGRQFSDVHKIVSHIFERNLQHWAQDHQTFTNKKPRPSTPKPNKPKSTPTPKPKRPKPKK